MVAIWRRTGQIPLDGVVPLYHKSHEIQTQYPDCQRLLMSRKNGVGQVINTCVTVVTLVALMGRLRVIKTARSYRGAMRVKNRVFSKSV
jgi:hypothetical protein